MPKLSLVFEKTILIPNTFDPLVECCLSLDRQQHKVFLNFLEQAYFNEDPLMIALYKRIINTHKRKSTHIRAKRFIKEWESVSKNKITVGKLKKAVKELYRLVLQFLVHDYLNKEEKERLHILQKALSNKGTPTTLSQINDQRKQLLNTAKSGINALNETFWMHYDAYYEQSTNYEKDGLQLIIELEQHHQRLSEAIESVLLCEKTNLQTASTQQDNHSESELIAAPEIDLKALFERARSLHDQPNGFSQAALDEFSAYFLDIHHKLETPTRLLLCKNIINVLSVAISLGQDHLKHQLLAWFKRKVEWDIQPVLQVTANSFINIVLTACGCKDFSYAIWYLQEYGDKTTKEALHLSDAYYYFFKGEYEKVISILEESFPRFSVSQLAYTLRTKTLLLRACLANEILHENGFEKFLTVKDDFRVFLKRKEVKLPQQQYIAYSNFMLLSTQILHTHANSNNFTSPKAYGEEVVELTRTISHTNPLLCKGWLLEVIRFL